jgi:A/G-specific adenine glycosylase
MWVRLSKTINLADAILDWYDGAARDLPWRSRGSRLSEPYHVWLSEIMLQQTTVQTVIPYYQLFLERWPTIDAIARADLDDILHTWQGLGYYARARNLHKCAIIVSDEYGGRFPRTESQLLKLPGVGPYTAAAIAAIAFNIPTVPVDGNIERVISRLHSIKEPVRQTKRQVRALATRILPQDRPSDFAQALMDLGATVCRPKYPNCANCPLAQACTAFNSGFPELYPIKLPQRHKPTRHGVAFWLQNANQDIWMRKRPLRGLLGGMIEVPSTDWREKLWTEAEIQEFAPLNVKWTLCEGLVTHSFTHFHLHITVWAGITSSNTNADGFWYAPNRLSELALPTLMKKIISHVTPQNSS